MFYLNGGNWTETLVKESSNLNFGKGIANVYSFVFW